MKVHIIRTEGVEDELYFGVASFLRNLPGPYDFITSGRAEEPDIRDEILELLPKDERYHFQDQKLFQSEKSMYMMESNIMMLSWDDLFSICNTYRNRKRVESGEVVILLTEYGNYPNWFAGYDPQTKGNYFVHTGQWELYTEGDSRYPIAYQLASILLKQAMFETPVQMLNAVHKVPRGCMLDFCEHKKDIILKLRTADICGECQQLLAQKRVAYPVLKYTIDLFEEIRRQLLFRERYGMLKQVLPLLIKGRNCNLFIPDMGMLPIQLTAVERAVYLLFLDHPEGIRLSQMQEHYPALLTYMNRLSRRDDPVLIENGVKELCRQGSNSLSEKMARIRKKFSDALGEEMGANYTIKGPNGGLKKIEIPRNLVKRQP